MADIRVKGFNIPCIGVNEADVFGVLSQQDNRFFKSDCEYVVFPGFCDVHVHLREPGFSYKETIKSGSQAAAASGYTAICAMPNLKPVPDTLETLQVQLDIIERDAAIKVLPYGSITLGEKGEELAELEAMAPMVCAFSDDGKGVQNDEMMLRAMTEAKRLDKLIAAHCEDNSLLGGSCIHAGVYAKEHGYVGISSESEYAQIARDLELVRKTGCAYHVCHISTRESVELIRKAKAEGLNVSCETGPHYLVLCDEDLEEDGRFKMNPPLRSREDMLALRQGMLDGTIDMIATDHAPHSVEEKSGGLRNSVMGVVGLETAFPVMYTEFVKPGLMSIEKLIELMCTRPRERFGIPMGKDFTVYELSEEYSVDPDSFKTMGRSSPFAGRKLFGKCVLTVMDGKIVYSI